MIISFTNVIGAIRSLGEAAQVITTNLKMWLGFETSETLGREEVVNGDFSDGTTGWSPNDSTLSVTDNVLEIKADGTGGFGLAQQTISTNSGSSYSLEIKLKKGTHNADVRVGSSSGGSQLLVGTEVSSTEFVTQKYTFTAVSSSSYIMLRVMNSTINSTAYFENISVKELTQITPDKSGNNNVGELFTGKALEFNGSTTYVSANSFAGTLSNNTAFTFAIWFNSDKIVTDYFRNILISSGGPQQFTNIFKIGVNPQTSSTGPANVGGIYFDDSAGAYNNVVPLSGGVNYNDGEWHRLVVSRPQGSGNQDLSFYVDGSLIGTADCNPYWNNVNLFDFGQEWDGAGTSDHFEGKMSNIQVYDYAWTTDDVTYDYANPQNLVTDRSGTSIELSNLKGYWHLSEGAGSLTYDSSGEGNNGTINGATYEPAQPRIPQLGMMNWSKGSNLLPYSNDFSNATWQKSNITVTPNSTTSPDNNTNANLILETSDNDRHLFFERYIFGAGLGAGNYTVSIFLKKQNNRYVFFQSAADNANTRYGVIYDFDNEVVTDINSLGSPTNTSYEIQQSVNGFVRLSITQTNTSGDIYFVLGGSNAAIPTYNAAQEPTYTGNTSNGFYAWGGQLEESSSAGAYRLTDGGATLNSTVIANPTIPTKDIFGSIVRDRLNSFNLDGSGYSSVANNSSIKPTSALSIECWVKTPDVSLASKYISDADVGTTRFFLMQVGSKARFKIATTEIDSATNLTNNSWHYIAGTWDGTTMTLYVDEDTPVTISKSGAITYDTDDLFIGSRLGTGEYFDGLISDVRLYDRALSSDEVENNYNAGLSAHTN